MLVAGMLCLGQVVAPKALSEVAHVMDNGGALSRIDVSSFSSLGSREERCCHFFLALSISLSGTDLLLQAGCHERKVLLLFIQP